MSEGARAPSRATFPIRLERFARLPLLAFGVMGRASAGVTLADGRLRARFGFFGADIPLAGIERWEISGPYRWWRAIGVRGTWGQPELTFGGSAHGGVCLYLREPVHIGWLDVRRLYLTLDDLDGFGAALAERGIPGADLRAGSGRSVTRAPAPRT